MQYLLYYLIYFRVHGTIREVFVINVMDATLANREVFMWWHAHDAEVALVRYKKAHGIPSPL
jgi:hypothetical protein